MLSHSARTEDCRGEQRGDTELTWPRSQPDQEKGHRERNRKPCWETRVTTEADFLGQVWRAARVPTGEGREQRREVLASWNLPNCWLPARERRHSGRGNWMQGTDCGSGPRGGLAGDTQQNPDATGAAGRQGDADRGS